MSVRDDVVCYEAEDLPEEPPLASSEGVLESKKPDVKALEKDGKPQTCRNFLRGACVKTPCKYYHPENPEDFRRFRVELGWSPEIGEKDKKNGDKERKPKEKAARERDEPPRSRVDRRSRSRDRGPQAPYRGGVRPPSPQPYRSLPFAVPWPERFIPEPYYPTPHPSYLYQQIGGGFTSGPNAPPTRAAPYPPREFDRDIAYKYWEDERLRYGSASHATFHHHHHPLAAHPGRY